jgi:hypothetical protein
VGAVAVAWTLAWPGVTGAIVGARSPAQVDGWLAAASLELSDADLDEIAAAIELTNAGEGPPGRLRHCVTHDRKVDGRCGRPDLRDRLPLRQERRRICACRGPR